MPKVINAITAILVYLSVGACTPKTLDRDALLDPINCKECHEQQFDQWQSSMHAYAADDPVFIAMNQRGQRETNGELGTFCVNCHAPMAVREGLTSDGLNLDSIDQKFKGVTCYFCHQADAIEQDHNNGVVLNEDGSLRGAIADPVDTPAHHSSYSALLDRAAPESSQLCGSCHDVITQDDFHLETTYLEWQESLYSKDELGAPLSCGGCHMSESIGQAAQIEGAPERRIHLHNVPGVDVALDEWPGRAGLIAAVQGELFSTLAPEICVQETAVGTEVKVTLENVGAGHTFPSGSTHHRRAWVEVRGFRDGDEIFSTGVIGEDEAVVDDGDPQLWRIFHESFDSDGELTHMLWEAASIEGEVLPAPVTINLASPDYIDPHTSRTFFYPTALPPERVSVRVRIRPIGRDVLLDLIESGDLEARYLEEMPTFDLGGSVLEWQASALERCNPPLR